MRRTGTSIATTLTWVNMSVSGVALLLAAVVFAAYDRASFRDRVLQDLSIQAQIVGTNSVSALVFNDPKSAEATLSALRASTNLISADILTPDSRVFARYQRDLAAHVPPAVVPAKGGEVRRSDPTELSIVQPIVFNGKPAGTVFLRSDLEGMNSRRTRYLALIAAVLVASMIAALLMSRLLQRSVSTPIVQLAEVAYGVSQARDYSVRAQAARGSANEIVMLTDAFNDMLAQIQAREADLHGAQRALEERVLQRTADLEEVNKELEAFSYSVSHDLRAPLRHVIGFSSLLEDSAKELDAQSRRYIDTIVAAAKRMGQLIDDLLAFSRIGRDQLTPQQVSLNNLLREAREEVAPQGRVEGRDIEWHVADLPDAQGDPAMLRLVLINLLSNAVKYTAPRTTAVIEVGVDGAAKGEVVVFVRDNGVGFDPRYADKLFGVFQRLHRSEDFEGTGIGLANVRRIINRHGGRVWAESELARGATFFFSLPLKGLQA